MPREVVITGYGVFSAFGFGGDALLGGVFAGRHAFSTVTRFDPAPFRTAYAATYPGDGRESTGIPGLAIEPDSTPTQREIVIACARAAVAMAGAREVLDGSADGGVPVLLGTSGDLNQASAFWRENGSAAVADTLAADLAESVAAALGLDPARRSRRTAYINACIASTNAIISGARMIRSGRADTVISGGAYVMGEMTFSMFDSGRAMSRDGRVRPFSGNRSGLLLGDGAAVFVLESREHAEKRAAVPLARLSGWGMAADAYHVVQPHPNGDGLVRAAERALSGARAEIGSIDYVNAHGTGTALNDKAETAALHRVFGPAAPKTPISSTKGATGHMLEATGAVELAITVLAIRHGLIPPTCGYENADPDCDLDYVPGESRPADIRRALTLNAAFGGANAALLVERV